MYASLVKVFLESLPIKVEPGAYWIYDPVIDEID